MPTYKFKNLKTGVVYEDFMSIKEMDKLRTNPNIELQMPDTLNIVSQTGDNIDAKVLYSDIDRTNLINDVEHDLDFITEGEVLTRTMAIQAEEWGYNYAIYMDHKFPYLLSQIYNLKIDKILYIDPQDCYFYISALDTCKTLFSPIQKKGQLQLSLILNRAIQEG